jgi:ABC-type nitrate/sulfonate/bicarbonate transport system substrate-binding protein
MGHVLLALLCSLSGLAAAQAPLKVNAFPGAAALPLIVGTTQGLFEKHGVKVELLFTQSSQEQRDDLAGGASN